MMSTVRSSPLVCQTKPIILRSYFGRKVAGTAETVNVLRVIPSLPASPSGVLLNSLFEPAGASGKLDYKLKYLNYSIIHF